VPSHKESGHLEGCRQTAEETFHHHEYSQNDLSHMQARVHHERLPKSLSKMRCCLKIIEENRQGSLAE